jgi:hypothetical protein
MVLLKIKITQQKEYTYVVYKNKKNRATTRQSDVTGM